MMGMKTLLLIFLFVTQDTTLATDIHPRTLVGAPINVSKDDHDVQKLLLIAASSFNGKSNDAFLYKPSAIDSAQVQVVEGLLYNINFEMSRTVCRNSGIIKTLSDCDLQPRGPLHKTLWCHFEAWVIPWEKETKIQVFKCKD